MLLVDTNVFLAGRRPPLDCHDRCAQVLRAHRNELAATTAVIPETAWLLLDRLGPPAQADLLRMVATERLNVATIATLNRRDFAVVRPRHVSAFELIP